MTASAPQHRNTTTTNNTNTNTTVASSSPSSSPPSPPRELNLLTLNCWGLLHISALRAPRLAEIGRQLAAASPSPDIVCLQECWTQEDYRAVRAATAAVLPHGKFYHSGAWGGGLAILSRWPIEASSMVQYPLNGRPTAFWRGDWYVGKGVACATVRIGPGRANTVEIFNTHTHAPYESDKEDSYACHRTAQAWELSKLLRAASSRGHLVVALGDFNMLPQSLAHRVVTGRSPVRDAWRVLHPDSALGPSGHPAEAVRRRSVPTAEFNLRVNGVTSDSVYNTWRWTKSRQKELRAGNPSPVDPDTQDPHGQRLDYIFTSSGTSHSPSDGSASTTSGWVVKSAAVEFTGRHPDLHVSLSDHFAVRATLQFHTPSPSDPQSGAFLAADGPTNSSDTASDYDAQLRHSNTRDYDDSMSLSVYDDILSMIHKYTAREVKQRYWRGAHFYAAMLIWIACLVAVWFSPANFVAFILMLVSSLNLVAGTIDGLLALLFFSWELRNLKEFEWEVQTARDSLAAGDEFEK